MRFRDEPGGSPFIGQVVSGMQVARVWSAAAVGNLGRRVPILGLLRTIVRQAREGVHQAAETVRCRVPLRPRWRTSS
jgi:hypothetical protein